MSDRAPLSREISLAAAAVEALRAGRALPAALDAVLRAASQQGAPGGRLPEASQPAVRDMAHQATRQLGLVGRLAEALNRRPPAPKLAALQAVALSQLIEPMRAEAVIVDQAVAAARADPEAAPAAGFLNATLRNFVRGRETLLADARRDPVARWNHPAWWIEILQREYPGQWESILAAGNAPPPMTLRVNRRRLSTDAWLERAALAGIDAHRVGEQAVVLARAMPVEALPGWHEGEVSIQDAGAQLAAPLLAPRDGEAVLDACAGPGGKATHLLEWADCRLTALDLGESRLAPVRANLERLGQQALVLAGDARRPLEWWDGKPFQRILVDAPCTASGIVRRHPDIRWLRRPQDIAALSAQQSAILEALWALLEPGGTLLYATCSVFGGENEAVVERFLASQPEAARRMLNASEGNAGEAGSGEPITQLWPCALRDRDHDGFFYALLEKRL
jgi:16S rRNA (cytosine967-C5)-methyltransferase